MPNPAVPQVISCYPYDSYDFGSGLPIITRGGTNVAVQGTLDSLVTAAAAAGVALTFTPGAGGSPQDFTLRSSAQALSTAQKTQVYANLGLGLSKQTAIPYAAAITPNSDNTEFANVAQLTGVMTVNAPAGTPVDGQIMVFRFIQDATGRVITWSSSAGGFAFGTDFPSANVPSSANAKFEVVFRYNGTDSKWRCVSIARGF